MKRKFLLQALAGVALTACALPSFAQATVGNWPDKPVKWIVPFPPGGAMDAIARTLGEVAGRKLGQPFVIENKAGAGGNIAHQQLTQAPIDGSVILLGSVGPLAIAPHLTKVGYDPQKDIAPLTMGMNFPNVLVVPPSLGVKTFPELIALAKSKPGELNFGSTGAASASHLAGELFNSMAGVDIVHIPFKGGAPALNELLGGRLSIYFATMSTAAPHIASGKLIPLATTGLTRAPFLPNLPTVSEAGLKGFTATNWYAFVAPGRTPTPILDRWNQELVKALKAPEVADELNRAGLLPAPGTREELARYIASESKVWGQVVIDRKIKVD